MRRLCRLLTVALILVALSLPASGDPATMAIWIWEDESFQLLDDAGWREKILDRLESDGINTLYVYADLWQERCPIVSEQDLYHVLLARCHERGFVVEALLGSAPLKTNEYVLPRKRDAARAMIQRVIDYNKAAPPDGKFDAIHLDIEPYTTKEWKASREEVAEHFVDAAREWRRMAHADGVGLRIGAAIPFWFDRVERKGESLVVPLLEAFDYVALMDYRDEAEGSDGLIAHARYEVTLAGRLGRKVIIGLETGTAELNKVTFYEEGRAHLEGELRKVEEALGGEEGFEGFAIHHLESWLLLRR